MIYTITQELATLLNMIEAEEIPEEAVADTLQSVVSEWEKNADDLLSYIKNLRATALDIKAEEEALAKRRKSKEKLAERLSQAITDAMQAVGRGSYESSRHKVTFRRSERLVVTDEEQLLSFLYGNHPEAIKVNEHITYDKDSIKAMLRDGIEVKGAEIESRQNIQIK